METSCKVIAIFQIYVRMNHFKLFAHWKHYTHYMKRLHALSSGDTSRSMGAFWMAIIKLLYQTMIDEDKVN